MKIIFPCIVGLIFIGILSIIIYKSYKYSISEKRIVSSLTKCISENPLYKFIVNEINSIDKDMISRFPELGIYDIFKNEFMKNIEKDIKEKIKNDGYDWINRYIDCTGLGYNIDSVINKCMAQLLKSSEVDFLLVKFFAETISVNIAEAYRTEQEAIIYHKSFGTEPSGDPVLHPIIKNNTEEEYHQEKVDIVEEYID